MPCHNDSTDQLTSHRTKKIPFQVGAWCPGEMTPEDTQPRLAAQWGIGSAPAGRAGERSTGGRGTSGASVRSGVRSSLRTPDWRPRRARERGPSAAGQGGGGGFGVRLRRGRVAETAAVVCGRGPQGSRGRLRGAAERVTGASVTEGTAPPGQGDAPSMGGAEARPGVLKHTGDGGGDGSPRQWVWGPARGFREGPTGRGEIGAWAPGQHAAFVHGDRGNAAASHRVRAPPPPPRGIPAGTALVSEGRGTSGRF